MRYGKLKRFLKRWQEAGLISEEQSRRIAEYMRVESHRQFLRLIRVLFVLGAFWLLLGAAATLRLINVEIFVWIGARIYLLATPLIRLAQMVSPAHYRALLWGTGCLAGWTLLHGLGLLLRKSSHITLTRLGHLQEKELQLGTAALTMGYILASAAWQCFNEVVSPASPLSYAAREAVVPWFSFVGVAFFLTIAYRIKDQIALLFGIGFLSHAVGFFTAYTFAAYWIGVQMPMIQLLVGFLLILLGLLHIEKVRAREDHPHFLFGRTYEWTGMLLVYFSLWIMSLWGITKRESWGPIPAHELWIANLLFIAAALGAMFYGAAKEDRMFFNFGLTFFIIESYTLFFSHLWSTLGTAFGSLLLGAMLIGTGYLLRHLWLQGRILQKPT